MREAMNPEVPVTNTGALVMVSSSIRPNYRQGNL